MRDFEHHAAETGPLPDRDLAGIPFLDRISLLEEIQRNYFRPQLTEAFRFGLRETRPETIRLAEMLLDANRRREGKNLTQQAHTTAAAEYEAEKQAIRRGDRGGRRIQLKVEEAAATWRLRDDALNEEEAAQRIINNSVIDLFIHDYLLTSGGIDRLLAITEDLASQSTLGPRDVLTLLDEVSTRIVSREPHEEANYLCYKDEIDNFVSVGEAEILRRLVTRVFSPEAETNIVSQRLNGVSADLLEFYWRNTKGLFKENEETPLMAFLYDFLYAATSHEELSLIEPVFNYLHDKLNNPALRSQLESEFRQAFLIMSSNLPHVVQEIRQDHQRLLPNTSEDMFFLKVSLDYLQKWDPQIRKSFIDTSFDRITGLFTASEFSRTLLGRHFLFIRMRGADQNTDEVALNRYRINGWASVMSFNFPHSDELSGLTGNILTKSQFLKQKFNTGVITHEQRERDEDPQREYLRFAQEIGRIHPEWSNEFLGTSIPRLSFTRDGLDSYEEIRSYQERNRRLFDSIRNENYWFVAENGDQYHINSNPELAEHSIRSITFFPSPRNSGFRVDLLPSLTDYEGNHRVQTYFIDNAGHFSLNTDGSRLRVPLWARLPFERFILDRLHFITSGALGQRGRRERRDEGAIPVDEVEARRSHWRTLTSSLDRIYTLTSQAAIEHAEFVHRVYGIDIYNENLRRRAVGTLDQDQCITFIQAVVNTDLPPNEIVYNPRLLQVI